MISALYVTKFYNRRLIFLSLLFCVSGVYLALRLGLADLSHLRSGNMSIMAVDFGTRLLTVPKVLVHYLELFIFPKEISLTQDWVITEASLLHFYIPLFMVIFILCALAFWNVKRPDPNQFFFSLWFLGGWLVHSQLAPLDGTVSDRWFYFTMIGLLGILLLVAQQALTHFPYRKSALVGLAVLVCAFGYRSYSRSKDFQDALTLYSQDLKVDPNSFYLNNNLGLELLNLKRYGDSIPYFRRTIELSHPGGQAWLVAHRNLAVALIENGNLTEAKNHLLLIQNDPDPRSTYGMVMWYQRAGKLKELKEFLRTEALVKFPRDPVLIRQKKELDRLE
jgi:tetratricopeptide (TPR) repeat protein